MPTVAIKVAVRTAKVAAQPVHRVTIAPSDGARVVVVAKPGPPGPTGPSGAGTGVFNETPSGTQDGVNAVFTLANTPQSGSTTVYRNGLREVLGTGYTATSSTLTFSTPPLSSDVIRVDYLMEG